MRYGEKIANLRKENNLTQEQFAELLNVSRQSVSKWESCSAFPETEKLIKISNIFSCSIDYLLKDEIEDKDNNSPEETDVTEKSSGVSREYLLGIILTYLSFPPLFGFIVGIFSIKHQKRTINNEKMINLTGIGMIISAIFTAIMIKGFASGM